MADRHIYLSPDSEAKIELLKVKLGIASRSGVIAKLIRDASEEDSTND